MQQGKICDGKKRKSSSSLTHIKISLFMTDPLNGNTLIHEWIVNLLLGTMKVDSISQKLLENKPKFL
jgi:hypothetical protein